MASGAGGEGDAGPPRARRALSRLEEEYERLNWAEEPPALRFEPMLPRLYELLLPSLDSRLNFISVGQRHAAFLRHAYGPCGDCEHAEILREKVKLFAAILTKLLDVNGILEQRDVAEDA